MNDNNDSDDFMTWYCSLSDDDQIYALNAIKDYVRLLGVPTTPEEREQARIDGIAGDLLSDVEI